MHRKQHIAQILGCLLALLMFALPVGQGFVAYKKAEKIAEVAQERQKADKELPHAGKITMLSQAASHTGFASIHHWPLAEWPSFQFSILSPSEALLAKAPSLATIPVNAYFKAWLRHCISPQAP